MGEVKLIKANHLDFDLMGPEDLGVCQECGREHHPDAPHDKQSMFYQYKFYNEHGRWPTWKDAIEHCPDKVKEIWTEELEKLGVKIE